MELIDIQQHEVDAVLDLIHQVHGYDFHQYATASIKRRIVNMAVSNGYQHISQLMSDIHNKADFFDLFVKSMSVTVTEMFRNPWVFKVLQEQVLPKLSHFEQINIWHAGCATGEEVYSMAILLKEQGLLAQSQIYATDFNHHALTLARIGQYPLAELEGFNSNYLAAGGQRSFSDYYQVNQDSILFDDSLKKNMVFSNHNLIADKGFGQMNLVICRNVLIYFNQVLQNNVLNLFRDSLSPKGFLLLGDKESIDFSSVTGEFETHWRKEKIYQAK